MIARNVTLKHMRSRRVIGFIAGHRFEARVVVRFTFAVILASAFVLGIEAQTGAGRAVGTVEYVDGDVSINGAPADFGQPVEYGDWVQTGPAASIDIVFDRANIFRLGENTVAVVEVGTDRQRVDLKYGTLSAVFNRVRTLSGRGTFDVRTPTAVAGVRGTSFFLRVLDRETTYVCACNGTLELDPYGEDGSFLDTAAEHSAHYFRDMDGVVTVEAAPEVFHDNDTLNAVADVLGLSIPWGTLPE